MVNSTKRHNNAKYSSKNIASICNIKWWTEAEVHKSTLIRGDFCIYLFVGYRTSKCMWIDQQY